MVDTISNAKSIRQAGSATTRYGAPPAASHAAVAPVSAADGSGRREDDGRSEQDAPREQDLEAGASDLRLEIAEDSSGNELVYRFVDAQTGSIVQEWGASEFGKLRDYMRAKKIHLLDKKV